MAALCTTVELTAMALAVMPTVRLSATSLGNAVRWPTLDPTKRNAGPAKNSQLADGMWPSGKWRCL